MLPHHSRQFERLRDLDAAEIDAVLSLIIAAVALGFLALAIHFDGLLWLAIPFAALTIAFAGCCMYRLHKYARAWLEELRRQGSGEP